MQQPSLLLIILFAVVVIALIIISPHVGEKNELYETNRARKNRNKAILTVCDIFINMFTNEFPENSTIKYSYQ